MNIFRAALLSGLLLLSSQTRAERFANSAKGYAFDAPGHWRLASPDFMLTDPGGASLSESDLPPQGARSLDKISKSAGMMACIGAGYQTTNERFALSGENWKGLVTVFVEPTRYNRLPRHVLQLVAQHGDDYRLFYLAVPTREWLGNRLQFTALLSALSFP